MLLDGHRIVSAAFYRRVVADDHRLPPRYAPDARDHPRARNLAAIHVARRKLADLEKGRARIEQPLEELARQQIAAARVALAQLCMDAETELDHARVQYVAKHAITGGLGSKLCAHDIHHRMKEEQQSGLTSKMINRFD